MTIDEAIQTLKDKGHKTTRRRQDILTFFTQADGFRTAKELHDYMTTLYDGISFDTVYRNLHLFNDVGILDTTELNGEKHFRIKCADHHHHHFICRKCGHTRKINHCPMDQLTTSLEGYHIEDHKFEVYGLCPACQS